MLHYISHYIIYFESVWCFTLLSASHIIECFTGTAVLVDRNTDVAWLRACSPREKGHLTTMLNVKHFQNGFFQVCHLSGG